MQSDHHRLVTMVPTEYGTKQFIGATATKVLLPLYFARLYPLNGYFHRRVIPEQ